MDALPHSASALVDVEAGSDAAAVVLVSRRQMARGARSRAGHRENGALPPCEWGRRAVAAGAVGQRPARCLHVGGDRLAFRSEEHTSELQSLMRISYAVFCLKKKKKK